ncbi:YcaO-like family protein [Roseococcus sp. SDR]|uniref:YcaO-like family protein n=1 Tax=Roseococcus sp. SDR TaxID=2835532 RepID=UPI001BCB19C1|nr:YcaO-like family protein [Roseococcus sp. SDR]MBS7793069.1 YcaO-like family protein [Roseococcus sp. SDR]MBV1848383.1 YcaO-like family protein [Roseococcus sp. SDR]
MAIPQNMLLAARNALELDAPDASGAELLTILGWDHATPSEQRLDRMRLLRAALDCRRVFALSAPDAPGLHCFGAEIDLGRIAGDVDLSPIGTSGVGPHPGEAFAACIGEVVEIAAQVETVAMRPAQGLPDELVFYRWHDGMPQRVPRDRALRRSPARVVSPAPMPLSIGCAAARSAAEARLRATLELVERDAVCLWWVGGRPPRPLAMEDAGAANALLATLRQGSGTRRSWLLDITTDLRIPAVAAVSFAAEGRGFCCGTAARATLGEAACAAVLELCQNELAQHVVRLKLQQRGETALNPRDQAMRARFVRVTTEAAWLLHPRGEPTRHPGGHADPDYAFEDVARRLSEAGFPLLLFEHASPTGIPVWRVISDGLCCTPSRDIPPRLVAAIAETGGGPGHLFGVSLFH